MILRWTTRRGRIMAVEKKSMICGVLVLMFVISRSITVVIVRIVMIVRFIIVSRTRMRARVRTRSTSSVLRRSTVKITITSTTVARILRFIRGGFKMLIKGRSWRSKLWFRFFKHSEFTKASWNRVIIFVAKGRIFSWGLDFLLGSTAWICGGSGDEFWIAVFCWKVFERLLFSREISWVLIF